MRVIPTQVATGPTSPHDSIKKTPVRGELSVARPSSRYLQCHCQQALQGGASFGGAGGGAIVGE